MASEIRYRRLFEAAQDGILILDADTGQIYDVNPFLIKLLGYSKRELLGRRLWDIGAFKDIRASQSAFVELQTKEYIRYEDLPLLTKDGRNIFVEFVSNIYLVDHTRVIQCNIRDITQRRDVEAKVKRSLKEKEILLKELHHRVNNNMQLISSLLRLQVKHIDDKAERDIFEQAQSRIKAISLVHEKLYHAEDFTNVDLAEYIRDLTANLFKSFVGGSKKISLKLDIERIFLKIDAAIACGLILNEFISNSLKYAFHGRKRGKVLIALRSLNHDKIRLTMGDDGVGIPWDVNFRKTKSLGLSMVIAMAEQELNGTIRLDKRKGTKFVITFNK